MSNETLITQIEGLREAYAQRQKVVVALQGSFKVLTDAQSKAQRVLRDFGAANVGIEVGAAQETFAQARLKEDAIDPLLPSLRRETKALATLTGALRDTAAALRTAPVDVVRLDKALTLLRTFKQQDIVALVPELNDELDLAQRGLADEFGQDLRAALAEQGIQIGGRPPRFEIGRFELEANFAKRMVTLRYGRDIVVPRAAITVEAAIRAYQGAAKAISGRNQDGATWLAQFYDAYETVRRKRGANVGRINIVDVYVEQVLLRQSRAFSAEPSKRTFTDYTRAQFIYDFYEFAERKHTIHAGQVVKAHSATKSHTENPAKSMWIVEGDTPYDGRYISDVEFVRD